MVSRSPSRGALAQLQVLHCCDRHRGHLWIHAALFTFTATTLYVLPSRIFHHRLILWGTLCCRLILWSMYLLSSSLISLSLPLPLSLPFFFFFSPDFLSPLSILFPFLPKSLLLHSNQSPYTLLGQRLPYKEKVARREIGALASSKNITRAQKVVAPSIKERPQRFVRSQINFNALDHVSWTTDTATRRWGGWNSLLCTACVNYGGT